MSSPLAPLSSYCRGSAYQMAALRESGLHTACDIIRVVRTDVESVGHIRNPPRPHTVYKKNVIGFLKQRCNAVFVDFDRLLDERVLFRGGEYPDQWYSIHRRLLKREEPASPSVAHRVSNGEWTEEEALAEAIRQSAHLHHSCDDLEEAAFNEALKQSVESMPPSPVLKTATAAQGPPLSLSVVDDICMDAPDELCCPITIGLMRDPVRTLRGQVYERSAIEDWFRTHTTDPMTGEKTRDID